MGLFEQYPAAFLIVVVAASAATSWIVAEIKQRLRG
jgi:hypothetical protein